MNSQNFLAHTLGFVLQMALPCSPHGRSPQRYFLLAQTKILQSKALRCLDVRSL